MLSRISLWAGLIGVAVTMPLMQTVTVAKSAVEVVHPVRTIDTSIARARRQGYYGDYFGSAASKYQQGDYRGALADYNRFIRINPKSANAHHNRGLVKVALQDYQGALADYDRAIQLKPNFDDFYNNRGNLKATKLQDYQGALADYDRAIQLKPRKADAYYNRGVLKYTSLKDAAGGIADMQQAANIAKRQGNSQDYQTANDLLQQWQQTSGK
jgi:tetratricopeptide (TPR) repeat protein